MLDILTAVFHDDPLQYGTACCLEEPQTTAERQVKCRLEALDAEDARELEGRIKALVQEQGEAAFRSGARFGAQLMAQLLEEFS